MSEGTRDMSEKKETVLITGSNGYLGYPLAKRFGFELTRLGKLGTRLRIERRKDPADRGKGTHLKGERL